MVGKAERRSHHIRIAVRLARARSWQDQAGFHGAPVKTLAVVNTAGSSYTFKNGTLVFGPSGLECGALLMQIHADWSPRRAHHDSLRVTAKPAGPDSLAGHGIIDAFAASGLANGGVVVEEASTLYDPIPSRRCSAGRPRRACIFESMCHRGGRRSPSAYARSLGIPCGRSKAFFHRRGVTATGTMRRVGTVRIIRAIRWRPAFISIRSVSPEPPGRQAKLR